MSTQKIDTDKAQQVIARCYRNWHRRKLAAHVGCDNTVQLTYFSVGTNGLVASSKYFFNSVQRQLPYVHCNVFTNHPYTGNSLTTFLVISNTLSDEQMLIVTREMNHFESVFISIPALVRAPNACQLALPAQKSCYTSNLTYAYVTQITGRVTLKLSAICDNNHQNVNLQIGQVIRIMITQGQFYLQYNVQINDENGQFTVLYLFNKNITEKAIAKFLRRGLGYKVFENYTPEIELPIRIFACSGELAFAGHPLLGASSSIHKTYFTNCANVKITFILQEGRKVLAVSSKHDNQYVAMMEQGKPEFSINDFTTTWRRQFLVAMNLQEVDIDQRYPLEVVSTGLKYLIVPVQLGSLGKAKILYDISSMLKQVNADFVYVVDISTISARTWENDGSAEDAATGSAAGPFAAYLVKHGICQPNTDIQITQGNFMNRPSKLTVQVVYDAHGLCENIIVSGGVCIIGHGHNQTKLLT